MKCTKISIGNTSPTDERTLLQFAETDGTKTLLGKLIFALVEEKVWSAEYSFSASTYGENPSLLISHPVFFPGPGNALVFTSKDHDVSVHGVENAVRAYLWKLHEDLQPGIAKLQRDTYELVEAARQIIVDKARAAIVVAFPEASEAEYLPFQAAWLELYVFGLWGVDFIYVARAIDNEITGGVVKILCSPYAWDKMRDGVQCGQRHNLFWSELARAFAIQTLGVPSGELQRGYVTAKEESLEFRISRPKSDPYVVEKVVFRITDDDCVFVAFGPDNLPMKAFGAGPEPLTGVVGLLDRHMTP